LNEWARLALDSAIFKEGQNMRLGVKRAIQVACRGAWGTIGGCLLCVVFASGQAAAPEPKPLMAEQVFKNIQVLRGVPVKEFMETMGFFSASLGANCTYCHTPESSGSWEKYADDTDRKQTARKMILMMTAINKSYFGGQRELTCYSCHRFGFRPKLIPSLAIQYGDAPEEEPEVILKQATGAPSPDQVLDKYFNAIGGAQRLATLNTLAAKGTYMGYEDTEKRPLEIYARSSGQITTITHTLSGDRTTTYDGRAGWSAAPDTDSPVPVLALTGDDLDGAKLDAQLFFPARIKQSLSDWLVGTPFTIGDRDVQVVQGMTAAKSPVKFYFDSETGLLLRVVRYTDSPVGRNPTQIDYSDYRDVAGIKMPFHITTTWTDGRSNIELVDVQRNVPIDAAKFAKPAPPGPPPATKR
jgi:outer membrane lipoprotein-sorting protein